MDARERFREGFRREIKELDFKDAMQEVFSSMLVKPITYDLISEAQMEISKLAVDMGVSSVPTVTVDSRTGTLTAKVDSRTMSPEDIERSKIEWKTLPEYGDVLLLHEFARSKHWVYLFQVAEISKVPTTGATEKFNVIGVQGSVFEICTSYRPDLDVMEIKSNWRPSETFHWFSIDRREMTFISSIHVLDDTYKQLETV